MYINKKNYFTNFLNILIILYPISFAIGNFAINLNTFLIILLGVFVFKKDLLNFDNKYLIKILILFFLYIIILTFFKNFDGSIIDTFKEKSFIKSILYLRYLLLFLVIYKLISSKLFNIRYFFLNSSIMCLLLGIDLLIQFFYGYDIFGHPKQLEFKSAGFFGDEYIAGSYLLNFSFFAIFAPYFFLKKKIGKNFLFFYTFMSIIVFILLIFLTGNRMPLILFFLSSLIFIACDRKLTKIFLILLPVIILISYLLISSMNWKSQTLRANLHTMVKHTYEISTKFFNYLGDNKEIKFKKMSADAERKIEEENKMYEIKSWHLKNFIAGVHTWKKNKIFGGGFRSYINNCEFSAYMECDLHPHNYYIQLMAETGIVGFVMIFVIFVFTMINFIKIYFKKNIANLTKKSLIVAPLLIFFTQFFPFKSSGSFFSTFNSTIIFILLAIILNINLLEKIITKQLKAKE